MSPTQQPSPADLLDVLCKRGPLLELLCDGVTDKRDLQSSLDCSRSTLNRGLRDLERGGLVDRSRNALEVTLAGTVAGETFSEVWEPLVRAVPLLERIDPDASFDRSLLSGATVVESSVADPDEPLDALGDLLSDASRVRATVATGSARYARLYREHADRFDSLELVIAADCLDALRSKSDHPVPELADSGVAGVTTTPEQPPYNLAVVDRDVAWLGVRDERGLIDGAIVNDDPEAVEWACEQVDSYREA